MCQYLLRRIFSSGRRSVSIILFFLFFYSGFLCAQVPERTFYISPDSDADCSDNRCGLQAALDSAEIDSANITFLLAEGVYTGSYEFLPDSGNCYGDLVFIGGWDVSFEKRNEGHRTVFDGEQQNRAFNIRKDFSERSGSISFDRLKVRDCFFNGSGGGMSVQTYGGDITINNCMIINNVAGGLDGTGGYVGGGILTVAHNPDLKNGAKVLFSNNYIYGNQAGLNGTYGQGGGIFTYAIDSLVLVDNLILNNSAYGSSGIGGGIELYCRGAVVLFTNNVFSGNFAQVSGGGTANHITSPYKESHFEYVNNIIYGNSNSSGYGGDIYSAVREIDGKAVSISYHNNIYGNKAEYPGTIVPTFSNNIIADPMFVDTMYHVSSASPAVNAGDNSAQFVPELDYFGNKRIQFDDIDIGVHEHNALVAHYKLDGDAEDCSLNGIDGYFFLSAGTGVLDDADGAAHVVSDTMRVLIPHKDELNIPEELSIAMWFNADSLTGPGHLLSKAFTCSHNGNFHFFLGRGGGLSYDFDRPCFSYYDGVGSNKYYICDDTILVDEWNFLALTYNFVTHDVVMFLNNEQVSGFWFEGDEPVGTLPIMVSYPMGIGASITAVDGCLDHLEGEGQYPFYGKIDEVRIYNQILDTEELAEIYSMPPYAVELSRGEMNENLAVGSTVGTFTAMDPNVGDTHTFEFVSGTGGPDNAYFSIEGNTLELASVVNYEEKEVCDILVEVRDAAGNSRKMTLRMLVNDMNDLPVLMIPLEDQTVIKGTVLSYVFVEGSFTDEDSWDHLSYSAKLQDESDLPSWLTFASGNRAFSGNPDRSGLLTVVVSARDDSSGVATDEFEIQIDPSSVKDGDFELFRIYPNPTKDYVFIENETGMYEKIRIYSITGEILIDWDLELGGGGILDLRELGRGVYFYRMEGEEERGGKIVKL